MKYFAIFLLKVLQTSKQGKKYEAKTNNVRLANSKQN